MNTLKEYLMLSQIQCRICINLYFLRETCMYNYIY